MELKDIQKSLNVAAELDDEKLASIAHYVIQGYKSDVQSRKEWWELTKKAMAIAKQTWEEKSDPFPKASNVKFPLISQAVIDFAARQYPQIIQNDKVVRVSVVGQDADDMKAMRGNRVTQCMSYQLLNEDARWEEDTDHLLHVLPMVGTCFKKVYYHPIDKKPIAELCTPENIVISNNAKSLDLAPRITHVIYLSSNDVQERISRGLFQDVDISSLYNGADQLNAEEMDEPIELLEVHCSFDLDEDGYREPYIITVHEASGQVLRIVQRFNKVEKNKDKVVRIVPEQYFIDYHFIRSVDGSYYSFGFGQLLYALNESINTTINQLLDAGTLNNYQSGFIGSALRLKNGSYRLNLNEWKVIQSPAGSSIKENIVPLPTKEPSMTLFNLLSLLIDVGRDLTSTNDLMQGKGQTQNVPATTVLSMIEQGMKVYNAISKRLFLSMKKEFKRLFDLNYRFLSDKEYQKIVDDVNAFVKTDFNYDDCDIYPVADPGMSTESQRIAKAQAYLTLPTVDQREATIDYLRSMNVDEARIQKLVPPVDPNAPPPPEVQETLSKVQVNSAQAALLNVQAQVEPIKAQLDVAKGQQDAKESDARIMESAGRVGQMQQKASNDNANSYIEATKVAKEHEAKMAQLILERHRNSEELSQKDREALAKLMIEYQKNQNDAKKSDV